jgi:hypothetical protein
MPIKKLAQFRFTFQHKGETYQFWDYYITNKGKHICYCDLTATKYYGDESIALLCCKIAIDAYNAGKTDGKLEHRKEIAGTFKNLLGL